MTADEPFATAAAVDPIAAVATEQRERIAEAIYGGIDVWEARLVIRTDKGSITRERLAEVLPELIEGGICIDVTVEGLVRRA